MALTLPQIVDILTRQCLNLGSLNYNFFNCRFSKGFFIRALNRGFSEHSTVDFVNDSLGTLNCENDLRETGALMLRLWIFYDLQLWIFKSYFFKSLQSSIFEGYFEDVS